MEKESVTQLNIDKKPMNTVKMHRAFGVLRKYANPSIMGKEIKFISKAIFEKYVQNVKTLCSFSTIIITCMCLSSCKSYTIENSYTKVETTLQETKESSPTLTASSIESIYNECATKTFCIFTSTNNNGTGFLYKNKYVITNEHVLYEADSFILKDINENEYEGTTIFKDTNNDIAIIEINNFKGQSVSFGDSDTISTGEELLLIGNPANGLPFSSCTGKRVKLDEKLQKKLDPTNKYITLNANITSGYSGGPAFNINGELIGINNACYIGDLCEYEFEHLSFIIPINRVKDIIEMNIK